MQILQNTGAPISHASNKTSIYKLVPMAEPFDLKLKPLKILQSPLFNSELFNSENAFNRNNFIPQPRL